MSPTKGQEKSRSSFAWRVLTGTITLAVGLGSPAPVESVALGISALITTLPQALADHEFPADPPPMNQEVFQRAYEWARAYEGDYRRMGSDTARDFASRVASLPDAEAAFRAFSTAYEWARAYEDDYRRMSQENARAFALRFGLRVDGETRYRSFLQAYQWGRAYENDTRRMNRADALAFGIRSAGVEGEPPAVATAGTGGCAFTTAEAAFLLERLHAAAQASCLNDRHGAGTEGEVEHHGPHAITPVIVGMGR